MANLNLGIISHSLKESEYRLSIHPDHFNLIPPDISKRLIFEKGYGESFGIPDRGLKARFGGLASREEILSDCDLVVLLKPLPEDLALLRKGGVLWGWVHCVQQKDMAQQAIDRKQTLLAWEAMFMWNQGVQGTHLFCRNNEMAGYCGVIHALGLTGIDGTYGPPCKAVVLGLGSVAKGSIYALHGHGICNISAYYPRVPPTWINSLPPGCRYGQMVMDEDGAMSAIEEDGTRRPLADALAEADIIVNGILQDTDRPMMYIRKGEEKKLKPGCLIVDVSCDEGMGFPFARPTSFAEPTFNVDRITYYAVDHTPSFLWRSASWEISRVVVPYLGKIMGGPNAWEQDETIRRAIEIRDGVIQNKKILTFQNRSDKYPHPVMG